MGKERMLITGGHALEGQVRVSGGKNTAVAVIPATLLSDEPCTIENLPDIEDVHALADILVELGAKVDYEPGKCMHVDPRPAEGTEISYRNAQRLRASYYLLGALLGRCGSARVPTPGGCEIGSRPVDQHLKGFRAIGAEADETAGMLIANGPLIGGDVFFDMVTVGATVNVMLAAVKAKGNTFIYNAAKEPHIVDLANFLNSMGAKLLEMGVKVTDGDEAIRVHVVGPRRAINVKTQVYPGFPTDLQQPMSALLTTARGTSLVTETIFEQRFRHLDEIRRMGAHVRVMDRTAIIEGVPELYGAPMTASDLRAGAALIVAALMARGTSEIYEPGYIDRGYEHIEDKLRSLGAEIRREAIE